jgi:transformation/transcription domain-associated protein
MSREDSLMAFYDRVKALHDPTVQRVNSYKFVVLSPANVQSDAKLIQLKAEVLDEIQTKLVPETVLTNVSDPLYCQPRTDPDFAVHDQDNGDA